VDGGDVETIEAPKCSQSTTDWDDTISLFRRNASPMVLFSQGINQLDPSKPFHLSFAMLLTF
jgi:hypothetical protein